MYKLSTKKEKCYDIFDHLSLIVYNQEKYKLTLTCLFYLYRKCDWETKYWSKTLAHPALCHHNNQPNAVLSYTLAAAGCQEMEIGLQTLWQSL
jgi:hypothetical protein